jgi:hypothetical protein
VVRDPKKEVMVFIITMVSLLLMFMIVLRYFVIKTSPLRANTDKSIQNLYFSLKMNKDVYDHGEPVILKLGVRNTSNKPVLLEFPTSLDCDFIVEREYDFFFVKVPFTIWKYSAQVGELQTPHSVSIDPGQAKMFNAQWNQNDFNGKLVKPGKYRITGVMNTKNFKVSLRLRGATE